MNRALRYAYEIDGVIRYPCPRCEAPPGATCTHDGHESKIPCAARLGVARRASQQELTNRANRRTHHQGENNG